MHPLCGLRPSLSMCAVPCLDCQPIRLKLERPEVGKSGTFELTTTTTKIIEEEKRMYIKVSTVFETKESMV